MWIISIQFTIPSDKTISLLSSHLVKLCSHSWVFSGQPFNRDLGCTGDCCTQKLNALRSLEFYLWGYSRFRSLTTHRLIPQSVKKRRCILAHHIKIGGCRPALR